MVDNGALRHQGDVVIARVGQVRILRPDWREGAIAQNPVLRMKDDCLITEIVI